MVRQQIVTETIRRVFHDGSAYVHQSITESRNGKVIATQERKTWYASHHQPHSHDVLQRDRP